MSITIHNREIQKYKISELLKRNIHIPEDIQRIITNHTVDEIVEQQLELLKKGLCEQFLGVINIHYCRETEQEYLLDGQHRYEAMKRLYTKHSHNVECFVEYVKVENYVNLVENYELINKKQNIVYSSNYNTDNDLENDKTTSDNSKNIHEKRI